ncbi:MAG: YceI family protein [Bacteroidetes bacterium]|nr:YceI family protein [Bacteroidota bacterium]
MKTAIYLTLLLFIVAAPMHGQDKYLCKNGHIWFYSETPLETIEAHNNEAASVLTPATGELVFQLLIKSFKFERALMEEHFNENYMESAKFPKSDFKGKLVNLTEIDFSKNGVYQAVVEGKLTIHNKTNTVRQKGTVEVKGNTILVKAKFDVVPGDYDIEIPSAVRDKIAKTVAVNVDMAYQPYKK